MQSSPQLADSAFEECLPGSHEPHLRDSSMLPFEGKWDHEMGSPYNKYPLLVSLLFLINRVIYLHPH